MSIMKNKTLLRVVSMLLLVLISISTIAVPISVNADDDGGGTGSSGKGGGGSAKKNPSGSIFDFVYVWYDDENFDPRTKPNTAPRQGWFTKGDSDISDTTWNFWIGALTSEINRMMVDGYGEDGWTAKTSLMKSERWDKMREAMVEACQNAFNRDSLATHSRIVGIAVTWGSIPDYATHKDNNSEYRQWYPVAMGETDDTSFYKMFDKKGPTPDMLSTSSNNDWRKVVKVTSENGANGTETWAEYIWRMGLADNPGAGQQFQVWVVAVTDNMPFDDTKEDYEINLTKYVQGASTKLAGAVFELREKNSSGNWVAISSSYDTARKTTSSSGTISWTKLPKNTYRIYEISAPTGYDKMDADYIEVTLPGSSSDNKSINGVYSVSYTSSGNANVSVYDPKLYSVTLNKYDANDRTNRVGNAGFTLYEPNGSGGWRAVGSEKFTTTSGSISWTGLKAGQYQIRETTAPADYVGLGTNYITFTLGSSGTMPGYKNESSKLEWSGSYSSGNATINVYEPKKGNIGIKKVNIHNEPISNVKFNVYEDFDKFAYVTQVTTNSDGEAFINGLTPGKTYYFFETSAPAGYDFDPNVAYVVTVVAGTTTYANSGNPVKNNPKSFTLRVYKLKEGGTDETVDANFLANAEFELFFRENQTSAWESLGKLATNAAGLISWTNLKTGYYYVIETKAPDGYKIDETRHEFQLTYTDESYSDGVGNYSLKIYNDPEGYWTPVAEKELHTNENIDHELKDEEFWFQLYESTSLNGPYVPVSGQLKACDKNGKITFDQIVYHKEDRGWHYYMVREVKKDGTPIGSDHIGDDNTVWYDDHTVTFQVNVMYTAPSGGFGSSLTVEEDVAARSGAIKWNNYVPYGEWKPEAQKILVGRTLKASEFEFDIYEVLSDGSLKHLDQSMNKLDGSVTFKKIIYQLQDVGTHTYRIYEYTGMEGAQLVDKTVQHDTTYVEWTVVVEYFGESINSATSNADGYNVKLKVTATQSREDRSFALKDSKGVEIDPDSTYFVNYVPVAIHIVKTNAEGQPLANATFVLLWSDDDGETWNRVRYEGDDAPHTLKGYCSNPNVVDGRLTTGADGLLDYGDLYPTLTYRLVEVEAPDGYSLLEDDVFVGKINPDDNVYEVHAKVVNASDFIIPKTSGNGFIWLTVVTMLMSFSLAIIILNTRKNSSC